MSEDAICDKINEASLIYANNLNSPQLMTYIKRLVKTFGLKPNDYLVAPYTYFSYEGFDVDVGGEMHPHLYATYGDDDADDEPEPMNLYQDVDDLDRARIALNYTDVLNTHAKKWKTKKIVLGLIGITMAKAGDTEDNSAHYVSYVYFKGAAGRAARLCMFDSGGWTKEEIYYSLMKETFDMDESQLELNTGVFEKDGGESKSEYTYVGQNIFCHTWSLWFWNQLLGNKLSMKEIDAMAGRGPLANRNNLIRIKNYVYNDLVPTVLLKFNTASEEAIYKHNFPYIFLNEKNIRKLVVFPYPLVAPQPARRRRVRRVASPPALAPGIPPPPSYPPPAPPAQSAGRSRQRHK